MARLRVVVEVGIYVRRAERVGVSRKTINTVENGVFVPSTVLALQLARALEVPVEAIFELPA